MLEIIGRSQWRLCTYGSIALALVNLSCTTLNIGPQPSYDARTISMQTLNLFNQRTPSSFSTVPWKGDWLFRRARLEVVDSELRRTRPDLIAFQELMEKRGSAAESDRAILGAGALAGYDWELQATDSFSDTQEDQYQAVAVGLPLRIARNPEGDLERLWMVGSDGYLALTIVELEEQPLYLFNVHMPSRDRIEVWYEYLQALLARIIAKRGICLERVVMTSSLLGSTTLPELNHFLQAFSLKDTSQGRGKCEIASDCYTATPMNELFMVTSGQANPGQTDRIYVHESALITAANVVFNQAATVDSTYVQQFGMSRTWPSRTFGWGTSVRLARCGRG